MNDKKHHFQLLNGRKVVADTECTFQDIRRMGDTMATNQITADERKAICAHYNKLMEELRDNYIKKADDNRAAARQDRENQEGGAEA